MTRTVLHAVICGIIVGALAFFVPKLLIGLFILSIICRAFHCCGRAYRCCGHGHGHQRMFYMADRIRKMSDAEYEEFKTNMGGGCCDNGYHHHNHCCGGSKSEDKECCKTEKKEKSN